MSQLFSPYQLGPLTLENRIVVAPMCQYSARQGMATDWHIMHLGNLALSGAGMVIIEATAVEPEGRITWADLGLWDDACETALARVLGFMRQHSRTPVCIQLAHAGRKASSELPWQGGAAIPCTDPLGWMPCAPSEVPYAEGDHAPAALDAQGLERVKRAFADAARRAARLGLDCVEMHSAHGYLLHEFLSPLTNTRTDQYGGNLENRMRFPLEVFQAMRRELPDSIPLGVRVSATDWAPEQRGPAWNVEDCAEFAKVLKRLGAAYIHVSSGGLIPDQQIPVRPGYQLPQAEHVRQATGMPTIAVGLITEPQQAEDILASGQADLVALGRAMLYNPRWPWHAAAALDGQVRGVPQYLRCQPHGLKHLFK